jgi:hypothetical protein
VRYPWAFDVFLALFILALPAPAAPAREEPPAPDASLIADPAVLEALGDLEARPGSWAEYLVQGKKTPTVRVRISVLTDPAPQGRYWLELDTAALGAPPQAARLLVHGSPARPQDIERMEIYMLGQAPIELPLGQIGDKDKAAERAKTKPPPKIVRRGEERVEVRGGKFTAQVLQVGDTRVWRSPLVPLWGLVKGRSPRQTIELLGSGREGAHSVFPDPPK